MSNRVLTAILFVLAVYALSHSPLASSGPRVRVLAAAGAQQTQSAQPSPGPDQPSQGNMAEMMKMHQQMMAEMKAADVKLDQLVKEMNTATGEAKISAIAQAVNELARRQKTMHAHMGMMDQHMMMGGRGMMRK